MLSPSSTLEIFSKLSLTSKNFASCQRVRRDRQFLFSKYWLHLQCALYAIYSMQISQCKFSHLDCLYWTNVSRAGLTAGHVFCMMPKHEVKYHGMQKLKLICSPTGRLPGFKPDSEHHSHGPTRVTIGDTTFGELGTALYLTGSFINHSCCPNLVDTYPENNGELPSTKLLRPFTWSDCWLEAETREVGGFV